MADGSITFDATLSTQQLETELKRVRQKIMRLQEDLYSQQGRQLPLRNELKSLSQELSDAREKLKEMQAAPEGTYTDKQIADQAGIVEGIKSRWQAVNSELEGIERKIGDLNGQISEQQSIAGNIESEIRSRADKAGEALENLKEKAGQAATGAKNAMSKVGHGVKDILLGADNSSNAIDKLMKRITGLAKRVFIFSVITQALRKMRQWLSNVVATSAESSAAIARLKGSLLTLAQPIIQVVIPAFTALVNAIAKVVASLASLVSGIFGKTAKQSATAAKALNAQAGGYGSAGKAAKEAAKSIMAFDELNTLNAENEDSGGGGGSSAKSPDFSLFDGSLESLNFEELAKSLADKFNQAINDIPWAEIGEKIGKCFDTAVKFATTFLDGVDWGNFGRKVATSINNFLYNVDWRNLGHLLAEKIKIAIEFAAGFLAELDWGALAGAIGDIAIGFISTIDDLLTNADWGQVAVTLEERVGSVFTDVNWSELISTTFHAIGTAIAGLLSVLWQILQDVWNNVIVPYFQPYIDEWGEDAGGDIVLGILMGILEGLANIVTWLYENVVVPFVEAFKEVFGIHSPSTVMAEYGGYITEGFLQGITDTWDKVAEWFATAIEGIKKAVSDGWNKIYTTVQSWCQKIIDWFASNVSPKLSVSYWASKLEPIREAFSNIFSGISDTARQAANSVIGWINNMIAGAVSGLNSLGSLMGRIPGIGGMLGFHIEAPQIPMLAQGAVIPPNREFLAVLGDQSNGRNLEAPENLIRQIVREESGNGTNFEMQDRMDRMISIMERILEKTGVYLDGEELASNLAPHMRVINMERGW